MSAYVKYPLILQTKTKNTKSKLVAIDKIPVLKQIEAEKAAFLQSLNIKKIRLEEEKSSANRTLENISNQLSQIEVDIERELEIKEDAQKNFLNLMSEEKEKKTSSVAELIQNKFLEQIKIITSQE